MRAILAALLPLATPALAEVPDVVVDTAPVHSLVSLVMGDRGAPVAVIPPDVSPHDAALRPSDAAALAAADLVIWTGPTFLPWMGEAVASLAPEARAVSLIESEGWAPLPARTGADLSAAPAPAVVGAEAPRDPHAWLDPAVAAAWLDTIAAALAEADPEGAAAYRANAAAGQERLAALGAEVAGRLAPLAGTGYAVGHDAFQYFERAGGVPARWTVAPADGASPAPSTLAALRADILAGEVSCLLVDADTNRSWVDALRDGTGLRTAAVDPDGVLLDRGPGLYEALVGEMLDAVAGCLAP